MSLGIHALLRARRLPRSAFHCFIRMRGGEGVTTNLREKYATTLVHHFAHSVNNGIGIGDDCYWRLR